jgi:regulator of protease activity HflC (stomatin/prohibitin superfamily)
VRSPDAWLAGIVVVAIVVVAIVVTTPATTAAQALATNGTPPLTLVAVTPDSGTYRYRALPQRYLTIDKKAVTMGFVLEWRVVDTERFAAAAGGNAGEVSGRLGDLIENRLREAIGRVRADAVGENLPALAADAAASSAEPAGQLGVELVGVTLRPPSTN